MSPENFPKTPNPEKSSALAAKTEPVISETEPKSFETAAAERGKQRKQFLAAIQEIKYFQNKKYLTNLAPDQIKSEYQKISDLLEGCQNFQLNPGEKIRLTQGSKIFANALADNDTFLLDEMAQNQNSAKIFEEITRLLTDGFIIFGEKDLTEWKTLEAMGEKRNYSESKQHWRLNNKKKQLDDLIHYWAAFPYLNYEPFIPEVELKKFKKLSSAEEQLPPEKKREIRLQKLEDMKQQMEKQKAQIAFLQVKLLQKIQRQPDLSAKEFLDEVINSAHIYKFSPAQVDFFQNFIQEYQKRHKAIKKIYRLHPDDKELFKFFFGREPQGHVQVKKSPLAFYFKCANQNDYARIYNEKFEPEDEVTPQQKDKALNSYGCKINYPKIPELYNSIIAESSSQIDEKQSKQTFQHETQHVLNTLFKDEQVRYSAIWDIKQAQTPKERKKALERFMKFKREEEFDIDVAKDEILAFYQDGRSLNDIKDHLTDPYKENSRGKIISGLYDYFHQPEYAYFKKDILYVIAQALDLKTHETEINELLEKVFTTDYHKQISERLNNIRQLQAKGYSRAQTVALLTPEHIDHWPKIANRAKPLHKK